MGAIKWQKTHQGSMLNLLLAKDCRQQKGNVTFITYTVEIQKGSRWIEM